MTIPASLAPLAQAPSQKHVVLSDYSARPGDVMVFAGHSSAALDNERAMIWKAPTGQHIVTIGFVDDHPWYPAHRTTVFLCDESGAPRSQDPQPGSQVGLVDHRGAAETWWTLTAPQRAKWQAAVDLLALVECDDQHRPLVPITGELEAVLRLNLPWLPPTMWPEWCRRRYKLLAGVLVYADGSKFAAPLGRTPPAVLMGGDHG